MGSGSIYLSIGGLILVSGIDLNIENYLLWIYASVDGDDFTIIKVKIYLTWEPSIMISVLLPELEFHLQIWNLG
jgi:hypothetical protein